MSYRSKIWQVSLQHRCQTVSQMSNRHDNLKNKSRGFENDDLFVPSGTSPAPHKRGSGPEPDGSEVEATAADAPTNKTCCAGWHACRNPPSEKKNNLRADSRFARRQLETALLLNDVSYWLCAILEIALNLWNYNDVTYVHSVSKKLDHFV